jgi:O-antigen ligase
LFLADEWKVKGVSEAIWVPLIWMFLAGSRFVSQWMNLGTKYVMSPEARLEGSPLDRIVFLMLIILGVLILRKRNLDLKMLVKKNLWIWLYFLFGGVSILWSDYPFVSFKRLIKALGNVVMALVILSEQRPYEAIGVIFRRLAFTLLPLSVLFIKYYPQLGRAYHMGMPMFTGVATQKNGLGQICLILAIYFCWYLLFNSSEENMSTRGVHYSVYIIILPMIGWLLHMSDSATSLGCTVMAVAILLISKLPVFVRAPRKIIVFGLIAVMVFTILEMTVTISGIAITALGRDSNLTTRIPMWYGLIEMAGNSFIGTGYESFWLGERMYILWENYGALIDSHNGYLETYLNLGFVGLGIIVVIILSGLLKIQKKIRIHYSGAILKLTFIVVGATYNWTEATFHGVNNMWLLLFLGVFEISKQQYVERNKAAETDLQSVY